MNNKNKNKLLIISIISIALILVLGITYAWLTTVLNGTQVNRIKAGTLDLVLDDNASNGIDLQYAVPQSDEQGLTNTPYTFKVINNGTINAEYKLYLEDEEIEETRLSDINIKYSLVRNNVESEPKLLSTSIKDGKRQIESIIINAGDTNNYSLRLWIDSETTKEEVANRVFKARIKLEAIQTENDYEDTYDIDGYLYDDNDNIINNGSIVVFSNPKYSSSDENGKLEINRIAYGKHTIYYVPEKTLDELKNLTEQQIKEIDGVGKAKISTYSAESEIVLDNGYIIKGVEIEPTMIEINEEFLFDYTGSEEEFRIPATGKYKLEVWGAQGGNAKANYYGGYGGYSTGVFKTKKGTKVYINVGGSGKSGCTTKACAGGYNGGGYTGGITSGSVYNGSGGGASHIATKSGLLSNLSGYKDTAGTNLSNEILIVAGGGGGATQHNNSSSFGFSHIGGSGGGISGGGVCNSSASADQGSASGCGGSQTGTGAGTPGRTTYVTYGGFGYGGGNNNVCTYWDNWVAARKIYAPGAGAGWYGGSTGTHGFAGGGSGYIASPKLITSNEIEKHMYVYNNGYGVSASNDSNTKTIIGNNVSDIALSDNAKSNNGYAKITYLGK